MQTQNVKASARSLATVAPKAKQTETAPTVMQTAVGTVTLKALLTEFDLPADGKLARRFLRKASFSWHRHSERWEFDAMQAADVRNVLARVAAKAPTQRKQPARTAVAGDI
jgi:hypothetical protein